MGSGTKMEEVASGSVSSPMEKASEPKGYIFWNAQKVDQIEWDLFPDPSKILNLVPYWSVRIGIAWIKYPMPWISFRLKYQQVPSVPINTGQFPTLPDYA